MEFSETELAIQIDAKLGAQHAPAPLIPWIANRSN
jgi:hypothetical protein